MRSDDLNEPVEVPTIMHVDMDSFFASVEIRDDPALAGLPVVVAGGGPRGVVAAASYAARAYGVRSAMATARARQLCNDLVVISPNGEKYSEASRLVMRVLHRFTPVIEQVSVDEAFLDVASVLHFGVDSATIARQIKAAVWAEVQLTCTVGVATNKTVAKIASANYKPDGLVVVPGSQTLEFLRPRPVRQLSGVGPSLGEKLARLGINTIGDLADVPDAEAKRWFGAGAVSLQRRARGLDTSVKSERDRDKSMSAERTFDHDLNDAAVLESHVYSLSDRVASRLRLNRYIAQTVSIKVKSSGGQVFSRSHRLPQGTDTTRRVFETARDLLQGLLQQPGVRPVRLVGVRAETLTSSGGGLSAAGSAQGEVAGGEQLDLFGGGVPAELGSGAAWRDLDSAVDKARAKFGKVSLTPASSLTIRSGGTLTKQELGAEQRDAGGPQP